jgi:hypothetical protein
MLDKLEEVFSADHRPGVAGDEDDRERAEDRVDCPPLEPELAQVGAGEERAWRLEELGR